jgi:hypothetical protein
MKAATDDRDRSSGIAVVSPVERRWLLSASCLLADGSRLALRLTLSSARCETVIGTGRMLVAAQKQCPQPRPAE